MRHCSVAFVTSHRSSIDTNTLLHHGLSCWLCCIWFACGLLPSARGAEALPATCLVCAILVTRFAWQGYLKHVRVHQAFAFDLQHMHSSRPGWYQGTELKPCASVQTHQGVMSVDMHLISLTITRSMQVLHKAAHQVLEAPVHKSMTGQP